MNRPLANRTGSGQGRSGPCTVRFKFNKFEHALGVGGGYMVNAPWVIVTWNPLPNRMTDMTENTTVPQLRWRAVIISIVYPLILNKKRSSLGLLSSCKSGLILIYQSVVYCRRSQKEGTPWITCYIRSATTAPWPSLR